jgi:dihydroneopterin aldolase
MIFRKEYDRLALRGMRFDCIIGILDHERTTPQPVELDVVLHFHMRRAAHEGQITHTIDYGRVVGELQFILVAARFLLLESAAEAIAAWLLMPPSLDVPRPQVEEVEVKLAKPRALAGRAVPEIAIRRQRGDFPPNLEVKPFGFVDVVFESPECGVYRERMSSRSAAACCFRARPWPLAWPTSGRAITRTAGKTRPTSSRASCASTGPSSSTPTRSRWTCPSAISCARSPRPFSDARGCAIHGHDRVHRHGDHGAEHGWASARGRPLAARVQSHPSEG